MCFDCKGTTKNAHTQGVLRFFLHMSEKSCTFAGESELSENKKSKK
jgi:hypothetical protein